MSISNTMDVLEHQLWPQGDVRDPLGIWGTRSAQTGDATGGELKVAIQVPAEKAGAYVYTCYSLNVVHLTGTIGVTGCAARLLTNWPDIDPIAGVQGYSSYFFTDFRGTSNFTPPSAGPGTTPLINPLDRYLLLFDPRPVAGNYNIAEIKIPNVDTLTFSFEGYGYYWDRSVLQAPGGLRHPGSS